MTIKQRDRIFTTQLYSRQSWVHTADGVFEDLYILAADSYLAQEDIQVVGVELEVAAEVFSHGVFTALKYMGLNAEVSQSGKWDAPGCLLRALSEGCVQTLAVPNNTHTNRNLQPSQIAVMFPSGLAVPVKEEGHLYLNLYRWSAVDAAEALYAHAWANIYYIKG